MFGLWILLPLLFVGLVLYWALVVTEGAYLGRRVVGLLYDWTPGYYDRVKAITWREDREWLIAPLLRRLQAVPCPRVLDVGTGTGRFPAALLADDGFRGWVWGVDISAGMLGRARERLLPLQVRLCLVQQDAEQLPFGDEAFHAVVCLETIEFTPQPERTIDELVRVLKPGGTLLMSNRVAWARWFPGRVYDDDELADLLATYPLRELQIHSWNSFYDLVWVHKAEQNPSVQ